MWYGLSGDWPDVMNILRRGDVIEGNVISLNTVLPILLDAIH